MALKLRNQWLSFSGMVALKVRTGGSVWAGVINKVYSKDQSINNFVLTIAGYGTGKSHLAVCLGALFSGAKELRRKITSNISKADTNIGEYIEEINTRDNLIIILNGMNNFNLDAEILKCARQALRDNGISDAPLRSITKSYRIIKHFVEHNFEVYQNQFESSAKQNGINVAGQQLKLMLVQHSEDDSRVLSTVNEVYRGVNGDSISWERGLSAGDVLSVLQSELCGEGKPFNKIIVLFDEFGRYIEYAAANPTIAGEASLQQVFEAVQNANGKILFTGFIQSDLSAYLSRIEKTSNIIRYIGRYENSEKLYLSSNFETILANLLKKNEEAGYSRIIGNALDRYENYHEKVFNSIGRWDRTLQKKSVWTDYSLYRKIILEGCFPLHPITAWLLSNASSWMQQRSTITFAAEMFASIQNAEIDGTWLPYVYPIDIIDSSIYDEMLNSEEKGLVQSQYCMLYRDILLKIGNKLGENELKVLKAVLVINIAKFHFFDKEDAQIAIRYCSSLKEEEVTLALRTLEDMHGVIAFDETSITYDLIAEASGFNEFKRVYARYRVGVTAYIEDIDSDLLKQTTLFGTLETSFPQEKMISSREWVFEKRLVDAVSIDSTFIKSLTRQLDEYNTGEEPRGFLIFAYCNDNSEKVIRDIASLYKQFELDKYAIIILFLDDPENSVVGALRVKKAISRFSKADLERFQKHVSGQIRTQNKIIVQTLLKATMSKNMITANGIEHYDCRLNVLCSNRFKELYTSAPPFVFDGFQNKITTQAKKYLSNICIKLFDRTLMNIQSYQALTRDEKNRINACMSIGPEASWQVFSDNCTLVSPRNEIMKRIYDSLESEVEEEKPKAIHVLLEKFSKPPYGMNLNALALFTFYYIAEKGKELYCFYGDEKLNASVLSDKIFKTNKLQPNEFRKIRLQINKNAEVDKLAELCKEATLCKVIDSCPEYKEKINIVARQEGILPSNQTLYAQTILRLDEGIRLLNVIKEREQKAREILRESKKLFLVHRVVKVFDYLPDCSVPVSEEYGLYCGDSVIKETKAIRLDAEQLLNKYFSVAISKFRCDITQLSQVKGLYKNVADTLRKHGFEEYANQTTERIKNLEAELIAKQKYESTLTELEKDLTMYSDASIYLFDELGDAITKMSNWNMFIKEAKGLPQTISDQFLLRIQAIISGLENEKESLLQRIVNVTENVYSARRLEDLRACEEDIIQLKTLHFDDDTDKELDRLLDSIRPRIQFVCSLPSNLEQLYELREQNKMEVDAVAEYEIEKKIKELEVKEKEWISHNILSTKLKVYSFTASDCVSWLDKTEKIPDFITDRTKNDYIILRETVVAQLHRCRIEGVVSMFESLSEEEKRKCLDIILRL